MMLLLVEYYVWLDMNIPATTDFYSVCCCGAAAAAVYHYIYNSIIQLYTSSS